MNEKELILLLFAASVLLWIAGIFILRATIKSSLRQKNEQQAVREELERQLSSTRQELQASINTAMQTFATTLTQSQQSAAKQQDTRLAELSNQLSDKQTMLQRNVSEQLRTVDARLDSFSKQSEQKLEHIRTTMETKIALMQEDNSNKLEQMRMTVDEKLQKTLDERLAQSFSQVSERLEQVYKGLGEMQTLAIGVGDLKKVLSNVKTRGILGEIQLAAILEQILSPEQYYTNVSTKKGSANVVEFAVRLPGDGENEVLLPIDAKFPGDTYAALMDAYDSGDAERVLAAGKELERRIKASAKDIRDKYLDPPNTTDFAIMFLPTEGLYAEVVRHGMIETLARDYRISIAGPTTMAALLNSLQMGFKTLAIQQRSGEVWSVLGAVKTEFLKFSDILLTAQGRLQKANEDLDKLIGTRTRAITRKLRDVTELPAAQSQAMLEIPSMTGADSDDD